MATPSILSIRVIADATKAAAQLRGVDSSIGKVGDSASKSTTKFSKFKSFIDAGAKVAAAGFAAAAGAAVKLASGAAEDQAAAAKLATTLKNTTGATDAQVASVENWITKQGQLYGVTDTQLRPALQTLATATGSITKSQKLASLAMNISAGTGKSLSTVSAALGKAYNGQVGGLSRLGIATKDSSGKTKTFTQLQAELQKKFGGQAARQADTFSGKMAILKNDLSEAGESIGYMLLPMLTKLANWISTKVIPKVQAFTDWATKHPTAIKIIAAAVGVLGGAFIALSTAMKMQKALKDFAAGMKLLNTSFLTNPVFLVIAAIVALVAIFVIAYKKSETFRNIVNGVWNGIKTVAVTAFNAVKNVVTTVFDAIKGAIMTAVDFITAHWKLFAAGLATILLGPLGGLAVLVATHFDQVKAVILAVVNWLKGLPAMVWSAISGVAGKIAGAFVDGWNSAEQKSAAIFATIVAWVKGVPGRVWTNISAVAGKIRDAFVNGWTNAEARSAAIFATIVNWLKGLPGRVWANISGVAGKIRDAFVNGFNAAKSKAASIGGDILAGIRGIPGKIIGLASSFQRAGSHIISSLINGLSGAGKFVSNIAGNIWSSLKGMINSAIRHINSALEFSVNTHIPGVGKITINPPDIPQLARGGIVRRPTLALIGEAGPEAVVPLSGSAAAGGYVDQRVFITVEGALDPDGVAKQINRLLTNAERRRSGVTLPRRAGTRIVGAV